MTKKLNLAILFALASIYSLAAQESAIPSLTAQESPTLTPVASPSPTPSPTRSVRISFVPPPLEGTISLGVYDGNGKLVRILHQQAKLDEFTIGADALVTKWDGKNDDGEDLSAGKYHARGFVVAPMKIREVGRTETPVFVNPPDSVRVKLIPNPLGNNEQPVVDVAVDFDDENAYLKTIDGLPFLTIAKTGDIMGTIAALLQRTDNSLDVFLTVGTGTHEFHISGVDQMMAFDCGDFELK